MTVYHIVNDYLNHHVALSCALGAVSTVCLLVTGYMVITFVDRLLISRRVRAARQAMLDARGDSAINPQEPGYWGDIDTAEKMTAFENVVASRVETKMRAELRRAQKSDGKKRLAYVAIGLALASGVAGAAVAFRSAIPFGSASTWSAAVTSDPNATQGVWFDNNGHAYFRANGDDYQGDTNKWTVQKCGARGDGTTLDTVAFQACIDSAFAAGGGTVLVPWTASGYKLGTVILKSGVTLKGDTTYGYREGGINKVTLLASASGYVIDTDVVAGADQASVQGFVISGLGSTGTGGGIRLQGPSGGTQIKEVEVTNFPDSCIVSGPATEANVFEDILIINCVLNRTRSAEIGAMDIDGSDHYINRCEVGTSESREGHKTDANLYLAGLVIRSSNNMIANTVGEISDIGIYVGSGAAYNRFSNTRGDRNYGYGWYIAGGENMFSSSLGLDNSQDTTNTYSGFFVSGQGNVFSSCWSGGSSGQTWQQKYGFDDSGVQYAAISSRSTYNSCNGSLNATSLWHQNAFTNVDSGIEQAPHPFHPADTTAAPNVEGSSFIVFDNYATPTNVTNFTGGTNGQTLWLYGNANVTLVNSASLTTSTAANKTLVTGALYLFKNIFGAWREIASPTTFTSALTFNGSVALNGGATASGSSDINLSGGTGALVAPTGGTKSRHFIGNSATPAIAAGTAAGTGPTISVTGTDAGGQVALTVGTSPAGAFNNIATITWANAYTTAPHCVMAIAGDSSTGNIAPVVNLTTTTMAWFASSTLTAGSVYKWNYICVQ